MFIPSYVLRVLQTLESAGHEAWAVGGCVRDSLLGREPSDWDVTTSALPEETESCFREFPLIEAGKRHGTIGVVCPEGTVEITAYRIDGVYDGHRKPRDVHFSRRLEDDLYRRDFTVNAMACHPERGLRDPFGGQEDLSSRLLRCVGEPMRRFDQDALRILRCLRFSAVLGFRIEPDTLESACRLRSLLAGISPERTRGELGRLLCGQYAARVLGSATCRRILRSALPELEREGLDAALRRLELLPPEPELRWAAVLMDCPGASGAIGRLRFSRREAERILALISHCGEALPMSRRRVKELLAGLGDGGFFRLTAFMKACRPEEAGELDDAEACAREILARGDCLSLSELEIGGKDLLGLGYPAGKSIGAALNRLLEEALDDRLVNRREELLARAAELLGSLPGR